MEAQDELARRIEEEAVRQDHKLGWSLYYCPKAYVANARLATIGLNPGGGRDDGTDWLNNRQLEDTEGNSYLVQEWRPNGGRTTLQRQVARLFRVAEVEPEDVVSLNAVPFRSPDWASLKNKELAIEFGLSLVETSLRSTKLRLIVGFGLSVIEQRLVSRLQFSWRDHIYTGWGRIMAHRYERDGQTLLLLPHLSRFAILGRENGKSIEIESAISKAMHVSASKHLA